MHAIDKQFKSLTVSLSIAFIVFSQGSVLAKEYINTNLKNETSFPYKQLDLSSNTITSSNSINKPIIIAVIDDGFNVQHPLFNGLIWKNDNDAPNNGIDDDLNGFIDDTYGWDVSDMDEDISPPSSRLPDFFHGTQSASVIAQIIKKKLGKLTDYPIKLMLVKAVSDHAQSLNLKDGYLGIQYATNNGAHVISNSWSGGFIKQENNRILNQARNKNIFIVNSVGNFHTSEPLFPLNHPVVFGVAGINKDNQLIKKSNYGEMVDLSAPALNILSLSSQLAEGLSPHTGTSLAAPMVAATAALMLLENNQLTTKQISACLKNSAFPIEPLNPKRAGQLGAGALNIDAAILCAAKPANFQKKNIQVPEGSLSFIKKHYSSSLKQWKIAPKGQYKGITLNSFSKGEPGNSQIKITSLEIKDVNKKTIWSGLLKKLPNRLAVEDSQIEISITTDTNSQFEWYSDFKVIPIIFNQRFCSGSKVIEVSPNTKSEFTMTDGSNANHYEAESSCQWLINANNEQIIKIRFTQVDLENNVDLVHLFRGEQATQKNFLYTVTGNKIPPAIIIKGGPVLVWFLSDIKKQHQGFSAKIEVYLDPDKK